MSTEKFILTGEDVLNRVLHHPVLCRYSMQNFPIYGVPRGGVPVAMLAAALHGFAVVSNPEEAFLIVDDLIDSGATMAKYPGKEFTALYDKRDPDDPSAGKWIVFPWEDTVEKDAEDHATRLLQHAGSEVTPAKIQSLLQFAASLG